MLQILLESAAARTPRPMRWSLASAMIHAAVVTTAVALTMRADVGPAEPPPAPVNPVYLPQPTPPTASGVRHDAQSPAPGTRPPLIVIDLPSVPTVDPTIPFSRAASPLGDIFARHPGLVSAGPAGDAHDAGVHLAAAVDRMVTASSRNPAPDYPPSLRRAGLEGAVLIAFVVDTLGLVEEGSLRVLETTHPRFADAVRRWLPRTRYVPAEIRGRRVRQLVQQRVDFTLQSVR